jgi:hypothetical protein
MHTWSSDWKRVIIISLYKTSDTRRSRQRQDVCCVTRLRSIGRDIDLINMHFRAPNQPVTSMLDDATHPKFNTTNIHLQHARTWNYRLSPTSHSRKHFEDYQTMASLPNFQHFPPRSSEKWLFALACNHKRPEQPKKPSPLQ